MAQIIDLGKLRFYWAGEYNSATVYEVNDVVKYGGNVYVYTYTLSEANHTPTDEDYWALMISGLKFEGEYDDSTSYQVGDGVAYGGIVYIAIADTTGNEPPNATYWSQFADGIQYEGSYSGGVSYQQNDVVTYGGKAYIAKSLTTGHAPTNGTYWDILVEGIRGMGNYANGTTYLPGDIVSYGGNVYINILTSVGNLPTNGTYWTLLNSGIKYIGEYSAVTAYKINEIVTYGAKLYVSKGVTTGNLPTNATYWDQLVDGISAQGVYNSGTAYIPGDLVAYGANIYICVAESTGNIPTNPTYFADFISSTQSAGAWLVGTTYYSGDIVTYGGNTYVALRETVGDTPDTATSDWQIFLEGVNPRGAWATSTTYYINDIVTRGGSTYRCLERHASAGTFATDLAATKWEKYNSGIRWRGEWQAATAYLIDDLVYNGVSTYIAVADFTSDATDFTNDTDWELLSLGADTLPTQLNQAGKFLSTNGTNPVWTASGTLTSLTVNEDVEILGDIIQHGDIQMSSRVVDVTDKIKTNNVATLTTNGDHYFDIGDMVIVAGVDVAVNDFNGTYEITGTPTTTTFTYTKAGANVGAGAVVGGTATVNGNIVLSAGDISTVGLIYGGENAASYASSAQLTNPVAVFLDNQNAYIQVSAHNESDGVSASTDYIAYADNGDDTSGWVDMGITSSGFNDPLFTITGPNDGYIFMSAPTPAQVSVSHKALTNNIATISTSSAHGFSNGDSITISAVDATFNGTFTIGNVTSNTFTYTKTASNVAYGAASGTATKYSGRGDIVIATDATGSRNAIVFAAGGLSSDAEQMTIIPNEGVIVNISTSSTSSSTGALVVNGGVGIGENIHIYGDLHAEASVNFEQANDITFGIGSSTFHASLTNPTLTITADVADYAQVAFKNQNVGNSASTDYIAYANNGDDDSGWIDMGITSNTFTDPLFTITGANDGYIFMEAPAGTTGHGNLVLATGGNGTQNKIVFAAGGLSSDNSQMTITPDTNVHIEIATASTSATTGAFTVAGGVGILGDMNVQGNVSVQGTITFGGGGTTVTTSNLSVTDPFVFVGNGNQSDIIDLGFIAEHTVAVSAITATVNNKALTNNIATLTTSSSHTYRAGDVVVVDGVDATFNGTYSIISVPSGTTFTYAKTASNVASTAVSPTGSASVSARRVYAGMARDASDGIIKAFDNAVTKPSTTVDFAEAGLTYSDIRTKDITAAAINASSTVKSTGNFTVGSNTFTVVAASGNTNVAGTLGVVGDVAVNTNKFNVTAASGNTTIAGTLGVTGSSTFTGGIVVTGTTEVQELREAVANVTLSSNTGTLDWTAGNVYYIGTAPSGAMTFNVTNLPTDTNYMYTVNVFVTQGSTGYIPTTFQIAGSSQTIKWAGGSAPTPTSSAGKVDIFSFTMHRTNAGAWLVYGVSSLNF